MCDLAPSRHTTHASRSGSYSGSPVALCSGSPVALCSATWSIEMACASEEQGRVRRSTRATTQALLEKHTHLESQRVLLDVARLRRGAALLDQLPL